jgi:hypothetical protein
MEEILLLLAIAALLAGRPLRFFEKVFMRGDVRVWLTPVDPDTGMEIGERFLHYEKDNLIVSTGKTIMARLLGGDASYKNLEHISKIGFGTDATTAAAGQTALLAEQFEKAAGADYPAFNQVRFIATMESAEGGSHTYREIGLKTDATEKLFSRLVISPVTKSSAYKIQVEWIISFQ